MIALRLFRASDLVTLHEIDQICFPAGIAYSKSELRYYLQHPKSLAVVAEEDGAITGFCIGQPYLFEGKLIGHIITIDVLPASRKRGIGKQLFRDMEGRLRQAGALYMRLEVAVDNLPAQAFYVDMGFERIGRIPGYYNGKLDALVMEKSLLSGE
ncbi:MAG TPA: GNAT family N-acetyltransferase [Alloacidobacterium sp.]|nr:GNAT family N-acetyltransferase [Alloacidobacterium sp.]